MSWCLCIGMTKTDSQANTTFNISSASDRLHIPVGGQAGGDLVAKLCGFGDLCLLVLLWAVCAMPECSVFWHHGVPCVGMLASRAPQGSSWWTVVKGGGGLGGWGAWCRELRWTAAVCVGQQPASLTEASFMTKNGLGSLFACDRFSLHLFCLKLHQARFSVKKYTPITA